MKAPIINIQSGHIPFLRVLIFYVIGIIVSRVLPWCQELFVVCSIACLCGLLVLIGLQFVKKIHAIFSFSVIYATFVLLGVVSYGSFFPENHFDRTVLLSAKQLVGRIHDQPIVKERSIRFPVRIIATIDSNGVGARNETLVMVTVFRDSTENRLFEYGQQIQFLNKLQDIPPPYNPGEFDYRKYLRDKGITHQMFVSTNQVSIQNHKKDWFHYVLSAREYFVSRFRQYIPDTHSFEIAAALVFGYRTEIQQSTLKAFANTGTIHILSVSGMHVTLVFWILALLLRGVERFKYGKQIRFATILVCIWLYVILTGMAPPILRAGIMITFFVVGSWSRRPQNSLNTLFASALCILVFQPQMLFDIGFQLSYSAMLGIFMMYPILKGWYAPKNKILKIVVEYSYVSIAAQLFTMPLAIYYFGQFPNYFLIANLLIAIPSTLVMYAGLGLMLLPFQLIHQICGYLVDIGVQSLFYPLKWINSWPAATMSGIDFRIYQVVIFYLLILCLFFAFNHGRKIPLVATLVCANLLMLSHVIGLIRQYSFSGIKVYNVGKSFAVAIIDGRHVQLFTDLDSIQHTTLQYSVIPDLIRYSHESDIQIEPISDHCDYVIKSKVGSLLVDNTGKRILEKDEVDLSIHRNNKWAKSWACDENSIQIFDGSNATRYLEYHQHKIDECTAPSYILKQNNAYVWKREL